MHELETRNTGWRKLWTAPLGVAAATIAPGMLGAGGLPRVSPAAPSTGGARLRMRPSGPIPLSPREREILELIALGEGNRAIAGRLFLSEDTVKTHVRRILDKLEARTRAEAVAVAIRSGRIE